MKEIALFCLLCLGSFPALAENAKPPVRPAPASRAPDLDFVNDNDNDADVGSAVPVGATAQVASASHSWIYLTLGFSAAAGGMAFYFWESGKSSAPTKTVQVFTDARD